MRGRVPRPDNPAMLRGRRAVIASAFALVATAAVVSGCGGGSQALALDPVAAAATKTQDAGAARIRYSLSFTSPQLPGRTFQLDGNGVIDGTSGIANFDLGSAFQAAGIPAGSSMTEIYLREGGDFVIYMQMSFLASQIPGGKQWIKLDVSKIGSAAGVDFNQLLSGTQMQPTDLLSMLKTEGAAIRKVGLEKVNGTVTTHYHVTVNLAKALKAEGLTTPVLSDLAASVPNIPEDVWIGSDGLVRRVTVSYGLEQHGKSVHMTMALDLYDYGVDLKIAAPPSDEVFDATKLAQQGLGSAFNR
jgi:hypothetical protein